MNSDFVIKTTDKFNRSVKALSKKHQSLTSDLLALRTILLTDPTSGIPLGKDCFKIRMQIASKNAGKSGGARVIILVKVEMKRITLLDIYDKSDKETITDKELTELIKQAGT